MPCDTETVSGALMTGGATPALTSVAIIHHPRAIGDAARIGRVGLLQPRLAVVAAQPHNVQPVALAVGHPLVLEPPQRRQRAIDGAHAALAVDPDGDLGRGAALLVEDREIGAQALSGWGGRRHRTAPWAWAPAIRRSAGSWRSAAGETWSRRASAAAFCSWSSASSRVSRAVSRSSEASSR